MVWHSDDFVEQFVINGVTKIIKCWEVGCAVSVAPGSFHNRIDVLPIARLGATAPRAGTVYQSSDDGRTVHIHVIEELRRLAHEIAAHATRTSPACKTSLALDVLADGQIISNAHKY